MRHNEDKAMTCGIHPDQRDKMRVIRNIDNGASGVIVGVLAIPPEHPFQATRTHTFSWPDPDTICLACTAVDDIGCIQRTPHDVAARGHPSPVATLSLLALVPGYHTASSSLDHLVSFSYYYCVLSSSPSLSLTDRSSTHTVREWHQSPHCKSCYTSPPARSPPRHQATCRPLTPSRSALPFCSSCSSSCSLSPLPYSSLFRLWAPSSA